jgi:hypothetical protein
VEKHVEITSNVSLAWRSLETNVAVENIKNKNTIFVSNVKIVSFVEEQGVCI